MRAGEYKDPRNSLPLRSAVGLSFWLVFFTASLALAQFGFGAPAGDARGPGFAGFEPRAIVEFLLALVLSSVLAALIAYHPRAYRKVATLEEAEAPKTFIMYSVVGAVIGFITGHYPPVSLVVFGIGGLLRFRTDVGAAKDTGRVILVTLVGLCCGLNYPHAAVIATAFGFVVILVMENVVYYRLLIKGIKQDDLASAAEAYRAALESNECRIIRERKNFVKAQLSFVFRAPGQIAREELEKRIDEEVPEDQRGALDWDAS